MKKMYPILQAEKESANHHVAEGEYYVFTFPENDEAQIREQVDKYFPFVICLILSGTAELEINLSSYILQKNDVLFSEDSFEPQVKYLSPDLTTIGICISEDFFIRAGVQLTGATMNHLFPKTGRHVLPATDKQLSLLRYLLNKLKTLERDRQDDIYDFKKQIRYHYLVALFYEAIDFRHHHEQFRLSKFSHKDKLYADFLELLVLYYKEERSVHFYAERLYVTPKYLSHAVKEITGKTAGELIDETVIQEAKLLLARERMTVKKAADALNFSEPTFFGKFFKRHTGIAPSEYRAGALHEP